MLLKMREKHLKALALGDSGVYGFGVTRKQTWVSVAAEHSGMEIINKGIIGDTTGGMLARLESDVFCEKPDIVIVSGGGNDIFATHSAETAKAGMWAIGNQCAAARLPILFLIGVTPCSISNPSWYPLIYFDHYQDVFHSYYDWLCQYVDTFGFLRIMGDQVLTASGCELPTLFQADGIHLNRQGHTILGTAVAEQLNTFRTCLRE